MKWPARRCRTRWRLAVSGGSSPYGATSSSAPWHFYSPRDHDDAVATAVGLIVHGVSTEKELQGVAGQPPDDVTRKLAEEGVPKAISDMLFSEYVAPSKGQPSMPMRAPEEVAKEYLEGVIGADVGWTSSCPSLTTPHHSRATRGRAPSRCVCFVRVFRLGRLGG